MPNNRILWVDRWPFAPILKELLPLGSVTIAPTISHAWNELGEGPFQLVITELVLPLNIEAMVAGVESTGSVVLDNIASWSKTYPQTPILVLTRSADGLTNLKAKEIVGHGQVLEKPIFPQEVYRIARQLLSGGGDGA